MLVVLGLTLTSSLALAQPYKKLISQAAEALEDAEGQARRAGGECRRNLVHAIDAATSHAYQLRKGGGDPQAVKLELSALASNASYANCPPQVVESIQQGQELLEEARVAMYRDRRGRQDWDDDRDGRTGPNMPGPSSGYAVVALAPLTVQPNATFEGEAAVRVAAPELRITGMQGGSFYMGARFRSYQGNWGEWVTTQQWTVPSDPYLWRNAFQHFFRYSTLAEEDFNDGRFIAAVAVFDTNGQVLATREVTFKVPRLPQLPDAPQLPPAGQAPPIVNRDCGTGGDIGCGMMRDGMLPLDGQAFNGLMQSLRVNPSETARAQVLQSVFQRSTVTAIQFGLLLDLFQSDMLRAAVAQAGARRIVNPQAALGYAGKWSTPVLQAQYTQLILAQGPGGQPPVGMPPVQPGQTPPPPTSYPPNPYPGQLPPSQPYPPQQFPGRVPPIVQPQAQRDCGFGPGVDPDCVVPRNGRYAVDGQTFQGMMASLRGTPNELTRQQMFTDMLADNMLTAMQLDQVLDQFPNELIKLDVGKLCASHLVFPQHAYQLANKWRNNLLGRDFTQALAAQR